MNQRFLNEVLDDDRGAKEMRLLKNAFLGFLIGLLSYLPLAIGFMTTTYWIAETKEYIRNIDDFLLIWFCALPALALSFFLGLCAGIIGETRSSTWGWFGAIIGGLLGPLIVLSYLSIQIFTDWANYHSVIGK